MRVKRERTAQLLAIGFVIVTGLGVAGALLNSNEPIGQGSSPAYDSSVNWADPLSFDATNTGAANHSMAAVDPVSGQVATVNGGSGAVIPLASGDSVGSLAFSSDLPTIEVADPARVAAVRAESDDRGWARSGPSDSHPSGSVSSPSASGRSAPYAGVGAGSFGGGGAYGGGGSSPGGPSDASGQLRSGVASSTSGEGATASGNRANIASSSAPGLATAPGLSSAPGLSFVTLPAQSAAAQAGLPGALASSNSAGSAGAATQPLQVAQVPEPSTLILLGVGLGFVARRRRRDVLTN